jgi:hypothetical protein
MSNFAGYSFIIMGLGMLGYLGILRINAGRAMSWPSVSGEIIGNKVIKECAGPSSSCYKPVITYRYKVKGETYESDRLYIGRQAISHELRARKIMEKFPLGSETSVYYDPENPKSACLVRKIDNPKFIMKFGIVLVIVGLLFIGGVFGA